MNKIVPYAEEAEMGVLGSMLIAPESVVPMMIDRFDAKKFFQPAHAAIYKLIVARWQEGLPVDVITLTQALRDAGELDKVGGASFVTHLYTFTPSDALASYYKEIVLEKAALRSIHETAAAVAAEALNPTANGPELMERLQLLLTNLARDASTGSNVASTKELVPDAIDRMQERAEGKGVKGIPSGLGLLDHITRGWKPGQMIVVAAREKEGKSSLARQFALEAAVSRDIPTAILSHEMGREEIIDALIATRSRIDGARIESGLLSEADYHKLNTATRDLQAASIHVFDEADCTVLQFRANARRAVQELGCKLIILDYLQLIAGGESESREQAVSEVARNVKLAAKELGVPIIALSQLNSEGVTQYARAIQQHLDKLIIIEHEDPEAEGDRKAWIRVKLQRGGGIGRVPVTWRPKYTRFDPAAKDDFAPSQLTA